MICEKCKGTNWVTVKDPPWSRNIKKQPCPDCTGGLAHCCDGIQEQPELVIALMELFGQGKVSEDTEAAIRLKWVEDWFQAHRKYREASEEYNKRLELVRAERELGNWTMNLHQEYRKLNEAQSNALKADNILYEKLLVVDPLSGE